MTTAITIINRLIELKHNLSGSRFAEKCDIPVGVMNKYLRGAANPTLENLVKIAHANNVSIDWLVGASNVSLENARVLIESDYVTIPIFSAEASAGCGSFVDDDMIIGEHLVVLDELNRLGIKKERACAIRARGDSMNPTLMDGDLLLIDLNEQVGVLDGVYAISVDEQLLVKRLRYDIATQGYHIISDNPEHENFLLNKSEMNRLRVCGRVRQVIKNL